MLSFIAVLLIVLGFEGMELVRDGCGSNCYAAKKSKE